MSTDVEIRGMAPGHPRLVLGDGRLVQKSLLGRRSVDPASRIVRIVSAEAPWARFAPQRAYLWLFVDADGHSLLRLYRMMWHAADLERLRAALGLQVEERGNAGSVAALRREFPGAIPWLEAHLGVATLLLIVVVAFVQVLLGV